MRRGVNFYVIVTHATTRTFFEECTSAFGKERTSAFGKRARLCHTRDKENMCYLSLVIHQGSNN
jgi:hypothetical protein